MAKKIKMFVGNGMFQEIEHQNRAKEKKFLVFISHIETGFYYVGLAVLRIVKPVGALRSIRQKFDGIAHSVIDAHTQTGKDIARAFRIKDFRITLTVFLLLIITAVSLLQTGPAVSYALQIKERVLGVADSGITSLTEAQALLESQQVGAAQNKFTQAWQSFHDSQEELRQTGVIVNGLASIFPQKREGEQFILAAQAISQAGVLATTAYANFETLTFSNQGIISKNGDTKTVLTNLESSLSKASSAVGNAKELLSASDGSILPEQYRAKFTDAKEKLTVLERSLFATSDLLSITNALLLGNKHVLLLMQNNNELRPTGGFIGTYGALDVQDGKINKMHVSSIYDLDGQLSDKIIPPHPLYAINNRWYMRDSNWFSNFPESSKKITSFYEKEGGESPDLIVAITPNIITDLLQATGPIAMPKYNVTLSSDNFVELTQVATSVNYDKNLNEPKQLLADFVPVLLQRLATLDSKQYVRVLEIFQQNLNQKHILLYSRDPALEARLDGYNWTGSLRNSDRDYVSIVSTNLGGTKTDLYLQQKARLESTIDADGSIRNTLTITKTNPLPNQSQYKNTSYMRVYVPEGSTLESSEGFTFKPMEIPPLDDARADEDVARWEQDLLKNVVSGTIIGKESGKTFFGNWLELAGGESKTVSITYTLPYKLKALDRYSLLLQKQAGATSFEFTYALNFPDYTIAWKSPGLSDTERHKSEQKRTIQKDEFIGFVLSKER